MSDEFDHYFDAMDEVLFNQAVKEFSSAQVKGQLYELVSEEHQTEKAYLLNFVLDGKRVQRWLPKSQVEIPYADRVFIPDWLIKRIKEEFKNVPTG